MTGHTSHKRASNQHLRIFRLLLASLILLFFSPLLNGQGWEHYFGGEGDQVGRSVVQTPDLGFMAVGYTETPDGQNRDVYLVKVDQEGIEQWSRTFGDNGFDEGHLIATTQDTAFVMIAYFENESPSGFYLLKLNDTGEEQWRRQLPNYGNAPFLLHPQPDGSFYLAGTNTDSTDVLTSKLTAEGIIEWTTATGNYNDVPHSMDINAAGKILLTGAARNTPGDPDNVEAFLMQLNANGTQDWYNSYGNNSTADFGLLAHYQADGTIWAGLQFQATSPSSNLYFLVTDEDGSQLSVNVESPPNGSFADGPLLIQVSDSLYAYNVSYSFPYKTYLVLFNEEATPVNVYGYPDGFSELRYNSFDVAVLPNRSGYLMTGQKSELFDNDLDLLIIKTDSLGRTYTTFLEGNVYADLNENCIDDAGVDYAQKNWLVSINGEQQYTAITDSNGYFGIRVDSGDYQVNVIPFNAYWQACPATATYDINIGLYDTINLNFPFQATINCPDLLVDISTPRLRRCFDNQYFVSYHNQGTATAENAYVDIELDEFMTLVAGSLTLPFTTPEEHLLRIQLGDVAAGASAAFSFTISLSCETLLGQTHCVEAHIYPDNSCMPDDPLWDGSSIVLDGICLGDSIVFTITNVGTGDMSQVRTGIIGQDDIIVYLIDIDLDAGEDTTIVIYPLGETVLLAVEQSPGHPGNSMPAISIELCGGEGSLGYITQYVEDDENAFISIDCQENIGSFDPNDKLAFPKGLGEQHIITAETSLEYLIRFQNTGTDTAFNVFIRDTIASELDLSTLRPGAASHPYTLAILEGNILQFDFDDILLPDSTTNELLSHGFVKFRINQAAGNEPGTMIENRAGIYFDFNEPVITPYVIHQIELPQQEEGNNSDFTICEGELFNGLSLEQDTVLFEDAYLMYYHVTHSTWVEVLEIREDSVQILVSYGDTLWGQEVTQAFSLSDTLLYKGSGCDSLITHYLVDVITGVRTPTPTAVKVYPNPAGEQLFVQLPEEDFSKLSYRIQAITGEHTNWITTTAFQQGVLALKLPPLSPGIYWLELTDGKRLFTARFTHF